MKSAKYSFELSNKFLSKNETLVFDDFLSQKNLDKNIWSIFESLFNSSVEGTQPLVLRVYQNSNLCGCVFIIKCCKYGRSLFSSNILSSIIDTIKIPFFLWVKFGCCMDMLSNPGFVKQVENEKEIFSATADYLASESILTIINDYTHQAELYPHAVILPALPHALIDVSKYGKIEDFIREHKNIKRKMKNFINKGGSFSLIKKKLSNEQLEYLQKCFISTSQNSVFYLPYQDLYLNSAINTSKQELNDVFYFVAKIDGEFLGYQAAIKTGTKLNTLHGAFDRTRKTNFHAYDLLFIQMTEFAIKNRINTIDFGAIVNVTKQRMVNKKIEMSYYVLSKYKLIQYLFVNFLKLTKVQGKRQLKFRNEL